MSENIAGTTSRVKAVDKRIINGKTDVNQLVPFKYKWAWDKYLAACSNHWMPQEVNMQRDIELWKNPNGLTADERRIVTRNLGFFSTADSLAANNIVLGTYRHITAPECRQYLLRQAFEEAIHCMISGTEILTENGFMDFRDLTPGTRVAQYHENGNIDFVIPDEILHDPYKGTMYRFENESGTYLQTVTPQHRCVVNVPANDNQVEIILAEHLFPCNVNFPTSGYINGDVREFTALDAFRVALQIEGNLVAVIDDYKSIDFNIFRFQSTQQNKIKRLKHLAQQCDFDFNEFTNKVDNNLEQLSIEVWIPSNDMKNIDKHFNWINISKVDKTWVQHFLGELSYWNGCVKHKSLGGDFIGYTTTSHIAADKIKTLSHLCGYQARIETKSASETYQVHIFQKAYISGKTIKKTSFEYDGLVHCVGVPTGMIVIRSEGRIAITGNTHSYQYIIESIGLDEGEIFNAYHEIPSIRNKDEFLIPFVDTLTDPNFETGTIENDQKLLKSLIVFACLMEGLFFYVGFTQILALGRQNKMTGAAEQYQYILRDESLHCNFGIDLINTIKQENPHLWTEDFKNELVGLFKKAVELEYQYAEDTMPRGVLGLNADMFKGYLRFIGNRRADQIGLLPMFDQESNPFTWMTEMIDLKKEKNFFESRVVDYQTGGALDWD